MNFGYSALLPWLWLATTIHVANAEQLTPFTVTASLNQTALTIQIEQQLTQAYRAIDYQLHIQYLPAARSLKMSSQGKFDGELFRIAAVGQHYPELLQVPVALARVELLVSEELFHFVHQRHQHLIPALSAQLRHQSAGKKRINSASGNGGDQK